MRSAPFSFARGLLFLSALGLGAGTGTNFAQTTWDGGGGDNNWSTAENWNNNVAPGNPSGTILQFAGSLRLTPQVNAPWTVNGLQFNSGAGAFVLGGSELTILSGGIVNNAANLQTLGNAIALGAAQNWNAASGSLTLNGPVNTAGFTLTISASSSARGTTIAGVVSGSGALSKIGASVLTLNGDNTFSGGLTLTAGFLTLGHNNALGSGTLSLNGGTLQGSAARTLLNDVSITANSTLGGTQTLTFQTGTFALTGNRTLTVTTTTTLDNGITESGGSWGFIKAGAGNLFINSFIGYTGSTAITGGILALGTGVNLSSGNLVLNGGMLLSQGSFVRALGPGANEAQFGASGGGFAARGGALSIEGFTGTPEWGVTPGFLSGSSLLLNSAIADNVVTWTTDFSLGSAARTINVADNTGSTVDKAVIAGVLSGDGGLVKAGAGRLELTGMNSYAGQTHIQAGEIAVTILADAGTDSSLGAPVGGNAPIKLGLTTVAGTLRYIGSGGSTDRDLELAGSTGGGILIANGTGAVVFNGAVTTTAAGAKTLILDGTNADANELTGILTNGSGTLSVTKQGTGTWKLSGSSTHTGSTTLNGGTLILGGNGAAGAGTLVLASGTLQGSGSSTDLANLVSLTGNIALAGSTPVIFSGAFSQSGNRTITANSLGQTSFEGGAFVLAENNQARVLTITGAGNVNISAPIQNGPGTGADGLTKSGAGTLLLSGTNTYTGTTTLSAGVLRATDAAALGAGALTLSGGTLQLAGDTGLDFGRNTTVTAAATIASDVITPGPAVTHTLGTLSIGTQTLTLHAGSNVSGGTAGLTFGSPTLTGNPTLAANAGTMLTLGAINTGPAVRTVTKTGAGTVVLSSAAAAVANGSNFTINRGQLRIDAGGALGASPLANVTVNSTTAGETALFDLNGSNQSVLALTFGGAGATSTSINSVSTGGGTLTLGGNVTYVATSNPLGSTLTGNLSLGAANRTFTINDSTNAADDLWVSAVVSGSGGIIKAGAGTLALTGANTYTGATSVTAGVLRFDSVGNVGGGASALGAPTTVANGTISVGNGVAAATLLYTGSGHSTDRVIDLAGTTGGATLLASGSGAIVFGGVTASGAGSKTLTLSGGSLVDNAIAGAIANNSVSNATAVIKTGGGMWILSGANTYTGATTVNNGTLKFGANNVLADTSAVIVNATTAGTTALLDLDGYSDTLAGLTFGGAGATSTSVNNVSTGTGTLTLNGNVTYAATNNPLGSTLSGNLNLGAATRTFTVNDSANAPYDLTVSAAIAGSVGLTKAGAGTLLLSGASTYSGTTTLSAGILRATGADALGTGALLLSGGTLQLAGDSGLNFGRNTTISAATMVASDVITPGAGVTHTLGTLTYGANTVALNVTAGLNVSGTAGLTFGSVAFNATTPSLNAGASTLVTFGALSDNGVARVFTKNGAGTLLLNSAAGTLTSGGSLVVNAGTVRLGAANALGATALIGVTVNANGGATGLFDLNGNDQTITSLTLGGTGGAGTTNNVSTGAGTLTLGGNVVYAATNNPQGSTLSGNLNLGAATRTFNVGDSTAATYDLSIPAVIAGSGVGLTKSGAGTLLLSGANTYTGTTTLSAGVLRATDAAALGAGALTLSGGTLQLAGDTGLDFGRNTTVTAAATITSDVLTPGPAVTHTLGTLTYGANNVTLTASAGANASGTAGLTFGNVALNATNPTLNVGSDVLVTVGALSDNGTARAFTKSGAGMLVLGAASGSLTSGGSFTVTGGVAQFDSANALGATALTSVRVNATTGATALFDLNGYNQAITTLTFGGTGGAGTTNNVSTGGGTLTVSGSITYVSTNNPEGAILSGNLNLGAATRAFNVGDSTAAAYDLSVPAVISSSGGGLTKSGAGALLLSGNNTFSGTTTISSGTLVAAAGSGSALGGTSRVVVAAGGTLLLGASNQLNNAGTMSLGGTFDTGGFSEGTLSSDGIGALTLSANSTLNFGAGASTVTFASFSPGSFTLNILSWTVGSDHLVFSQNQSGNLSRFDFGGLPAGQIDLGGGFFEIVPVPEPATIVGAIILLGIFLWRDAGHIRRFLRRKRRKKAAAHRL